MNFNGWKNYETWNVSLWINNDEGIYRKAVEFMKEYEGKTPYRDFAKHLDTRYAIVKTGDGVSYKSKRLSMAELNELMQEI